MSQADINWALDDLKKHGHQSSIDWDADYRFAEYLKDPIACRYIRDNMNGYGSTSIVRNWNGWTRLTQRRLGALRVLIKRGLVDAAWMGTGDFGLKDYGVRRTRSYQLAIPAAGPSSGARA